MKKILSFFTMLFCVMLVSAQTTCPTTVSIDGVEYVVVQISNQCWTTSNMRNLKYADGVEVQPAPMIFTSAVYPNIDVTRYGYLYTPAAATRNWTLVNNEIQGICPDGWHIPTQADMEKLMNQVSSVTDLMATQDWLPEVGTNTTGFNLLPAGIYNVQSGYFENYLISSMLLTAEPIGTMVYYPCMFGEFCGKWEFVPGNDENGYSVRCVHEVETPCVPTSSTYDIEISMSQLPYTFGDTIFLAGTETDTYTLHRTNAGGCDSTITLNLTVRTSNFDCGGQIFDHQNNAYNTVQIGTQCWMQQNLRATTSPASGHTMSNNRENSTTTSNYIVKPQGGIYNWHAAIDAVGGYNVNFLIDSSLVCRRGLCPEGWHVPTVDDWGTLVNILNADADANSKFAVTPSGTFSNGSYFEDPNAYFCSATSMYSAKSLVVTYTADASQKWNSTFAEKFLGTAIRCVMNDENTTAPQMADAPSVTTTTPDNITSYSASCGGTVTEDGGAQVGVRGVCYSTNKKPTISNSHTIDGSGIGNFNSTIDSLTAGATYYVRAYAINSDAIAYGEQLSFTTVNATPSVTTASATDVYSFGATLGGVVTDDGGATVTARGVCWSTNENPTINDNFTTNDAGLGSFSTTISDLHLNETYYVRAYATNQNGTVYGEQITFTTTFICGDQIFDHQNNAYNTVQFGTQCWMQQNLRATTSPVGHTLYNSNGYSYTESYYYQNSSSGDNGYLYNWHAALDTTDGFDVLPIVNISDENRRGLCPAGWHLPTKDEWEILIANVNQNTYPQFNITNSGIFSLGEVYDVGNACYWSVTPASNQGEYVYLMMPYINSDPREYELIIGEGDMALGLSIRCVYDEVFPCSPTSSTQDIEISEYELPYNTGDTIFKVGTTSGTYVMHRMNVGGCDSTITVNLTVSPITETSFTCGSNITDHQGHSYPTAQFGSQCWMTKNLRVTTSPHTSFSLVNSMDSSTVFSHYTHAHAQDAAVDDYLYNWHAALDMPAGIDMAWKEFNEISVNQRGLCPQGWRLPTVDEWANLIDNNFDAAKFFPDNTHYYTGYFHNGEVLYSWSVEAFWAASSLPDGYSISVWAVGESNPAMMIAANYRSDGLSIRCVRDDVTSCTPTSSTHNIEINESELPYTFGGDTTFLEGTETGTYVMLRTNAAGCDSTITVNLTVSSATEDTFTCGSNITDHQGHSYPTAQFGSQCWMTKNLRVTTSPHMNNALVNSMASSTVFSHYTHAQDAAVDDYLYNWHAALDMPAGFDMAWKEFNEITVEKRGLCPEGWHLPTADEWSILIDNNFDAAKFFPDNTHYYTGYFHNGEVLYSWSVEAFWAASSLPDGYSISVWAVGESNPMMMIAANYRSDGLSIRCVRD